MNPKWTLRIGAAILVFSTAALLIAADLNTPELNSEKSDAFTVHEWGTFTSIAGEDGYPITWDALGGKDDLPKFVNNFGFRCFKWQLAGTVRMETPVLYFYSPRELTADVRVQFPHGALTEWYPSAETKIYESKSELDRYHSGYSESQIHALKDLIAKPPSDLDPKMVTLPASLDSIDTSLRSVMGSIAWKGIHVQPQGNASLPFPTERQASRYYAARDTDASPLTVGDQHEKFLFYRGVGRFPVPLTARLSADGRIAVNNVSAASVPNVIFFENRGGHIGYRNVGSLNGEVRVDRVPLDGSLTALRAELESALLAQGLFPKEARAMLATWQDSWFEEGSRLIYLVPSATINSVLPLQVSPAPSQTARVFVGRVELIMPDMMKTMADAIAKNDDAAAERYGRFVGPILDRIALKDATQKASVDQFRVRVTPRSCN